MTRYMGRAEEGVNDTRHFHGWRMNLVVTPMFRGQRAYGSRLLLPLFINTNFSGSVQS